VGAVALHIGKAARIGEVEVDFFSGPRPTGNYYESSVALRAGKHLLALAVAPAGLAYDASKSRAIFAAAHLVGWWPRLCKNSNPREGDRRNARPNRR
jgi:hypothetical protein